jgi:hypothetical protein
MSFRDFVGVDEKALVCCESGNSIKHTSKRISRLTLGRLSMASGEGHRRSAVGFWVGWIVCTVGLAAETAAGQPVDAQGVEGWVGKQVVQRSADFKLKVGVDEIAPKRAFVYLVHQTNNGWLLL